MKIFKDKDFAFRIDQLAYVSRERTLDGYQIQYYLIGNSQAFSITFCDKETRDSVYKELIKAIIEI